MKGVGLGDEWMVIELPQTLTKLLDVAICSNRLPSSKYIDPSDRGIVRYPRSYEGREETWLWPPEFQYTLHIIAIRIFNCPYLN